MRITFIPATIHVGGKVLEGVKIRSGPREVGWIREYDKSTILDLINQAAASDTFIFGKVAMVEPFIWEHSECVKGKILVFSCTVSLPQPHNGFTANQTLPQPHLILEEEEKSKAQRSRFANHRPAVPSPLIQHAKRKVAEPVVNTRPSPIGQRIKVSGNTSSGFGPLPLIFYSSNGGS